MKTNKFLYYFTFSIIGLLFSHFFSFSQNINLVFPKNNSFLEKPFSKLEWNTYNGTSFYNLKLSTDSNFSNLVIDTIIPSSSFYVFNLNFGTKYFWKVGVNSISSPVFNFFVFNPSLVSSLQFWLASDTGITLNGSDVANWNDLSGNNYHAIQGNSSFQPQYITNIINNKPVIRFGKNGNSSDETFLTFPQINLSSNNLTVFLLYKSFGIPNGLQFILAANSKGISTGGTIFPGILIYDGSNILQTNLPYGSNSIAVFNNDKIFRNSALLPCNGNPVGAMSFNTIGTRPDVTSFFFYGDIAEVLVYNTTLSDSLKSQVENYLYYKYAPPVNLGPDTTVCSLPITLKAKKDYFISYLWQDSSTNDSIVINSSGTYYITATDIFNKTSYDTITINEDSSFYSVNLGPDTTICNGQQLILNAGPLHYSYTWFDASTSNLYNILNAGTYSISVTDCKSTISVDTIVITVNPIPVFNFGNDTTICSNSNYLLKPNLNNLSNYSFIWSDNSTDSTLLINQSGQYLLTVSDVTNCSFSDSVFINVDTTLNSATLGNDLSLCSGNFILLTNGASLISNYTWSDGSHNDSLLITNTIGNYLYSVTITNFSGCSKTDSINVSIVGLAPTPQFSFNSTCFSDSTYFTDLSLPPFGNTITNWLWDFGDISSGINNFSTLQNPAHVYSDTGNYIVNLTISTNAGCQASITQTIIIYNKPIVNFNYTLNCSGANSQFNDLSSEINSQIISWNWNFGNSSSGINNFSILQNPIHQYNFIGDYFVKLIVQTNNSCVDSIIKPIHISPAVISHSPMLYSPANNSFSSSSVIFKWETSLCSAKSQLQVSLDTFFTNIIINNTISSDSILVSGFEVGKKYYWKVRYFDGNYYSNWSSVFVFRVFTPNLISGLKLWLAADTGITLNGNEVNIWNDISGNNISAIQNTTSLQPQYITNIINNKPFIRFGKNGISGDETYLTFPQINFPVDSLTAVFVYKPTGIPNGLHFIIGSNSKGISTGGSINAGILIYDGSNVLQSSSAFSSYSITNFYKDRIFLNGIQLTTTGPPVNLMSFNTIGTRPDYTSFFFYGDIAEIILYNTTLHDTLRTLVEEYLRNKYSPPINLGTDSSICLAPYIIRAKKNNFINYLWQDGSTSDSLIVYTSGTYYITATDVFNKISYDSIVINFTNQIYTVSLGADTNICSGQGIILSAGPPNYSYIWSSGSTSNSLQINSSGNYKVTVTDCFGTISNDSINVSVTPLPVFNLGNDTTYCYNTSNILDPDFINSENYTFLWSDNSTDSVLTASYTSAFWLKVSDLFGCSFFDTIQINVDSSLNNISLGNDTSLCSGNNISLVTNENNITNYLWNDNSTNSSLVVSTSGEYWMSATNVFGCHAIDTIVVVIHGIAPVPGFSITDTCFGNQTIFTDTSYTLDWSNITDWQWIINNDTTTTQTFSNIFNTIGNYQITLTVTTDSNCSNTLSKNIGIHPNPIASYNVNGTCNGGTSYFTNLSTVSPGFIWYLNWNFGDNITSNVSNPQHNYSDVGNYQVQLIATSNEGCKDTIIKTVEIKPSPLANFDLSPACTGSSTWFFDLTQTLPVFPIIKWQWDFGDNNSSLQQNPQHVYSTVGDYTVSLIIKSLNGCTDTLDTVVSVSSPPVAGFIGDSTCLGIPLQFIDTSSVINGNISKWHWNFGNGTASSIDTPLIEYSTIGNYTVNLKVTSEVDCIDEVSKVIQVFPLPVTIFSCQPDLGAPPLSVNLINNTNGGLSYWNFGDGQFSQLTSPVHVFNDTGNYTIWLKVENSHGCFDSTFKTVKVIPNIYDLAVLIVDYSINSTYLTVNSYIANMGTMPIINPLLTLSTDKNTPIMEIYQDTLFSGESFYFNFASQLPYFNNNLPKYICVKGSLANNLFDKDLTNNEACKIDSLSKIILNLYPNPTNSEINLDLNILIPGKSAIKIYDKAGRIISHNEFELIAGFNRLIIDVKDYAKGKYNIQILLPEGDESVEFIKY